MAWFWTNNDDEEESYDDSEAESYYEESEDDEELSEEEFAEEYDDDLDDTAENDQAVPLEEEATIAAENEEREIKKDNKESGIPVTTESMNRGEDDEQSDHNNYEDDEESSSNLREDEFAELLVDSSSRSANSYNRDRSMNGTSTENSTNNAHEGSSSSTNGHHQAPSQQQEEDTTLQENDSEDPNEMPESAQAEEEEEVTTLEEKQSLLVLAAEHDRVDILQAILSADEQSKETLLNSGDSLHIAITHGSVNAVNCLLRMGADPSIKKKQGDDNDKTAWELATGTSNGKTMKSNIAPSKREGIRHAFTAEALRCIGADEVERLQQFIAAGVLPHSCDIGGRSLAEWTIDLGATQCQALVGINENSTTTTTTTQSMTMINRLFTEEDLPSLENRLEELNNLSKALSEFLDNLAEEVSVCSGLLLVGSGAAALAAHVKSLKQQKTKLGQELERHAEVWENSQDELAYWIRECGDVDILKTTLNSKTNTTAKDQQQASGSSTTEEEHDEKQRLKTQIAACETKIRMLRASIADLSEENERNLLEVERRGLQGGVRLVRSLRDEIVELEFQLAETNSGEAACRAQISLLQHHAKTNPKTARTAAAEPTGENQHLEKKEEASGVLHNGDDDEVKGEPTTSTAIIVRPTGGSQGFLPFTIWQMFLRIMGLSSASSSAYSNNREAVIV